MRRAQALNKLVVVLVKPSTMTRIVSAHMAACVSSPCYVDAQLPSEIAPTSSTVIAPIADRSETSSDILTPSPSRINPTVTTKNPVELAQMHDIDASALTHPLALS